MVRFELLVICREAKPLFKACSNLSIAPSIDPHAFLGSQLSFIICERGDIACLSVWLLFKMNHLIFESLRNLAIIDYEFLNET